MKPSPSVSIEDYILQDWQCDEGSNSELIEIASVIHLWSRSGNWLDLGCGPMLTVWPMFASGEISIWGCDRYKEIATFHENLKKQSVEEWPNGLQEIIKFYNKNFLPANTSPLTTTPINHVQEILICSILDEQPKWQSLFSTVIQVGCFGCLDSIQDLSKALNLVAIYLQQGGIFISETWLSKPDYKESLLWGGYNLTNLPAENFVSLISYAGLNILEKRVTDMDTNYKQRYIIVAEKS